MSLRMIGLAISILAVGGGCAGIYLSTRNDALAAYNAAPACASLGEAETGKNCRITETATITLVTWDGDKSETDVYFAFPGPYLPPSPARLSAGIGAAPTFATGAQVPVEVWGYRVTRIAGVTTVDNPANDPQLANLRITGVFLAVVGCIAAIALIFLRRLSTSSSSMTPIAVSDAIWR